MIVTTITFFFKYLLKRTLRPIGDMSNPKTVSNLHLLIKVAREYQFDFDSPYTNNKERIKELSYQLESSIQELVKHHYPFRQYVHNGLKPES